MSTTSTNIAVHAPGALDHKGPHPGMLAVLYTLLFCVGLYPVTALYKMPYWPGPWEPASVIVPYFQQYGGRVLFCITLQLGAMVCLGVFTAAVVSRLHFLGARNGRVYRSAGRVPGGGRCVCVHHGDVDDGAARRG